MYVLPVVFFLALPTPAADAGDSARFRTWAALTTPVPGPPEPIGGFAAGCLRGAVKLPADAPGLAIMRPKRHRDFGHPLMKAYLEDLGRRRRALKQPLVLVGDVGAARGGPMLSGHSSHQTGLDVDLWLRMSARAPTKREREAWSAPSFVKRRRTLTRAWGEPQVRLIATAADSPLVNRVFVSPAIKRALCARAERPPWLYKVRPWWGHEEHIHVRLNCPGTGAPGCTSQTPLDSKDPGCGEDLAWWFGAEAEAKWQEILRDKKPREFPVLPEACAALEHQ